MHEFFHSWKRKVGGVTLVIACVFMAAWVRNQFAQESLNVPTGASSSIRFISGCHYLNIVAMQSPAPENEMASFRYYHHKNSKNSAVIAVHVGMTTIPIRISPFRLARSAFQFSHLEDLTLTMFSLPYWVLVAPLTLTSAWLLLSKQTPKSKQVVPEHSNQG
jgi:hypothetical protein